MTIKSHAISAPGRKLKNKKSQLSHRADPRGPFRRQKGRQGSNHILLVDAGDCGGFNFVDAGRGPHFPDYVPGSRWSWDPPGPQQLRRRRSVYSLLNKKNIF